MEHKELSFQEFEKTSKTFKRNKAIGSDDLNGNIIMDVYDSIKKRSFLKNFLNFLNFPEKLFFQFLKKVIKTMLKTLDQFLFFQVFQSA